MAKFSKDPSGDFRFYWDEAAAFRDSPFSDIYEKMAAGSTFKYPKMTTAAEPTPWLQATIGGFCSAASLAGFKLEVRHHWTVGRKMSVYYSWADRRGSMLAGDVTGERGPKLFAQVCAALADWDPSMGLWRAAFAEVLEGKR